MVNHLFARKTFESDIPTYNTAEGTVLALGTIEVKLIEDGANRKG
jgi:hypothetical protein